MVALGSKWAGGTGRGRGGGRGQVAGRGQAIAPTMDGGGRGDGPCFLQRWVAIKASTRHPRRRRPYASEGFGKGCDEQPACESRQGFPAMDEVVVGAGIHHSPGD